MPINILMPALSPTMTQGNLARWMKKEGDAVKPGDVIAEIETDKATMEVEAVEEGKIGKILVPDGAQGVKVNDVIAVLLEEGESPGDIKASGAAPAPNAAAAPAPAPKGDGAAKAEAPKPAAAPAPAAPAPAPAAASGSRIFASPLAKRLAQQHGLDLSRVVGSGPHGRVVKSDIDKVAAGGTAKAAPAGAKAPPAAPSVPGFQAFGEPEFELHPHSMMRKTIARRLQESKQFVPHFYLTIDCEIDRLLKVREEVNAGSPKEGKGAFKLSVNDFIIKACAVALKQVPAANASWSDEGVKMYKTADISVAVAIPNGLITPIIRRAED